MTKPDAYYGEVAETYDSSREVKRKWLVEQAAVNHFLTDGPVLDVPFGTGRFVPIYRAKAMTYTGFDISEDMLAIARRKFPGVNAARRSIYDIECNDGAFGTAICVRFLEWLPLENAKDVIGRLRRMAGTLIVTITHGHEGKPEAYTYDFGKFLTAIDGLMIEDRRVTAHVRDMISEIFKLRPARWKDVVSQFWHDYPVDAESNIQRLADKFAAFFGLSSVPVKMDTVTVRAEYWSGDRIASAVDALMAFRFITSATPRRPDGPLTVIERSGNALMIDGRKRANLLMRQAGPHPVLVVRPR